MCVCSDERHLLHVVEASTVPEIVIATGAIVKEATVRAVEHVDAVHGVFAAVAVNEIE